VGVTSIPQLGLFGVMYKHIVGLFFFI